MSKCPSLDELLQFLEGADGTSPAIAVHIDGCPGCQLRLDHLTDQPFAEGSSGGERSHSLTAGLHLSQMLDRIREEHPARSDNTVVRQSSADAELLPGYTFLRHIGEGGSGDVYQARDDRLGRIVAVKVLKSELAAQTGGLARFEREARATAALEHEHIVRLHAISHTESGAPCLVFEHVEGESLKQRLALSEVIAPRESAEILVGVASGLAAAHRVGVIHRDIKPSNILIERETGQVRIADFGLARFLEVEAELTHEGMLAGTPNYMSPEQVQNPQRADARSDIYSAGILLYEMLTGVVPYRGTVRMVLQRRIHEDPPSLRRLNDAVPRDLETICLKAMSRDPARRYQTCDELIDDLTRWLDGRPILARPVGVIERAWRWSRRNPVIARLTALVVLMVCVGFSGLTWFTLWLAESKRNMESLNRQSNEHARQYQFQRDLAVKHLDQMVNEVQNELADRPETRQLRNRLLDIAMKGLADVQRTGTFSFTGAVSEADALNRLGDLARELGDHDLAKTNYEQAYEQLTKLSGAGQHVNDVRRATAMTLCNIGDIVSIKRDDRTAALRYEEARRILKELVETDSEGRLQTNRCLAVILERQGDVARRLEKWTDAGRYYDEAAMLIEDQTAGGNPAFDVIRDYAVLLQKQGSVALQNHELSVAKKHLTSGHKMFRNLATRDPLNAQSQRDLAVSFSRLAEISVLSKDLTGGYRDFTDAAHLFSELLEGDSENAGLMRDLAAIHSRQGELAFDIGLATEAQSHLRKAVDIYEQLTSGPHAMPDDTIHLQRCTRNLQLSSSQ